MFRIKDLIIGALVLLIGLSLGWFFCFRDSKMVFSEMPPFTENLARASDNFYHIKFDDSHYPCKLEKDGSLLTHPLYGRYVIEDYIRQYNQTGDERYLVASKIVADSSINKMENRNNALCFYYPKGFMNYSAFYKEMYSGLTSMGYAEVFYKLYTLTSDNKYLDASNKCFNSLTVPVEEGGVFWKMDGNCYISEYPFDVPDLVLNGAMDIAVSIYRYGQMNPDRKDECNYLFNCQINTIKTYIELFDIPSIHISRYMLSGPMCFKVDTSSDVVFGDCVVNIPNIGGRILPRKKSFEGTLYESYVFEDEVTEDSIKMNIMVSRISYPTENTITLHYSASEDGDIKLYALVPELSPRFVDGINPEWVLIGEYNYVEGSGEITFPIKWINEYVFGNPCVFNYVGSEGLYYNSYHYGHIDYLKKLYDFTGDEIFKEYAEKWEEYILHWDEDEIWDSDRISFARYH